MVVEDGVVYNLDHFSIPPQYKVRCRVRLSTERGLGFGVQRAVS